MTLTILSENIIPPEQELAAMSPTAPLAEAGRTVLQKFYEKLSHNLPVAKEGADPEGVHQLRVATRRLRAGLQIMEETVCTEEMVQPLRRKLRTLANAAGQVRDSDVFLIYLDEYTAKLPQAERAEFEILYQTVREQRDVGRTAMLEAIESKQTEKALEKLHHFLKHPNEGLRPPPSDPHEVAPSLVSHFIGSTIWRRYEGVLAYQTVLPAPILVLHRLRVACKRFRYTLDFFEEALPPTAKSLIKQLSNLQDVLGELHDYQVKSDLTGQLLTDHPDNLALQSYHAYGLAQMQTLTQKFAPLWEKFSGSDFKHKLAQLL